jgi:Toprim-like/CHC2 zinc finger/IclR helix-turn-helix domain
MKIKTPEKLNPFSCHGVNFRRKQGGQAIGNCLFCGKTQHFYVDMKTGQWDCKVCGKKGNVINFLTEYAKVAYEDTDIKDYKKLKKLRGLPIKVYRDWKLAWDGKHWLFPVHSEKKTVRDIRRWDPKTKRMKSTTGCKVQLYGIAKASKLSAGSTIYLCEGEHDVLAMSYILFKANVTNARAVGALGATTFKDEWVEFFRNKNTVICYDHDPAGELGTIKVIEKLKGIARSIKVLEWPDSCAKGYDIRDFYIDCREEALNHKAIFKKINLLVKPLSKLIVQDEPELSPDEIPSFEEVITVFKKYLEMNQDMVDALRVMLATVLSSILESDPLWVFIVSPPGGGKTALLSSMKTSPKAVYQSSITPHSLVSGFNSVEDPSLLPQLRRKCLIWKDFTEIMGLHPNAKEEVYSILRGAFDGDVRKTFGNGAVREYKDLYFSMLAGVTLAIYGDRQAALGERFLKFKMLTSHTHDPSKQIRAAILNVDKNNKMQDELQSITNDFLAQRVDADNLPKAPEWVIERMIAFAQIVGFLRTQVDRDRYGDNLKYRPQPEHGTRLAKQLITLGKFIAIVEGKNKIDYETYTVLEKIGFDTATGFHIDIVQAIIGLEEKATVAEISQKTGLPRSNVTRALSDLRTINAVKKLTGQGPKSKETRKTPDIWRLSTKLENLWEKAEIGRKRMTVKIKRHKKRRT